MESAYRYECTVYERVSDKYHVLSEAEKSGYAHAKAWCMAFVDSIHIQDFDIEVYDGRRHIMSHVFRDGKWTKGGAPK